MKRLVFAVAVLLLPAAFAQSAHRPAITGVSHIAVYTTDAGAAEHFYAGVLGAQKSADPVNSAGTRYSFSRTQWVEVLPLPQGQGINRLAYLAYTTPDAAGVRAFLLSRGQHDVGEMKTATDGSKYFDTRDPEGNTVQFYQDAPGTPELGASAISHRMIHVGLEVKNRAVEDRFYKDLLGFRPYWYGAMRSDAVDWVSQQVPDGHDWLEYMLVGPGTTTPLDRVDARELGVLDHFSLGVENMEAAITTLYKQDRLNVTTTQRHDGPQMGRDGKWQTNFYDPDNIRVEFMEFQPAAKPCCSGFTAASPTR
jgi:catechol 2,3-dioxygenase-like lactoylglutathione lyase family enzyme